MMQSFQRILLFLKIAILISTLSGCALQMISSFDVKTEQQIMELAKQVDRFYTELQALPPEKRTFQFSKSIYLSIEVELAALHLRQQVRTLNDLTTKQVVIVQTLWQQDKSRHQQSDGISNFLVKRRKQQYQRLFLAMIRGEQAKQE